MSRAAGHACGMDLRSLVSPVAPPLCVGCGASAGRVEPLCSGCRLSLRRLGGDPVAHGELAVWAPFAYEGAARALVRALKFRGAARVAATMGAQVAAGASEDLLAGAALVPVPLDPRRLRRRGYNQAERLARQIAVRRGCPVADCLERVGRTATQVGRSRVERSRAIEGTVRVRPGTAVPRRVVLVDDVITTGATIDACAAVLRGAGAERVDGLAYARTLGR